MTWISLISTSQSLLPHPEIYRHQYTDYMKFYCVVDINHIPPLSVQVSINKCPVLVTSHLGNLTVAQKSASATSALVYLSLHREDMQRSGKFHLTPPPLVVKPLMVWMLLLSPIPNQPAAQANELLSNQTTRWLSTKSSQNKKYIFSITISM